MYKVCFIPPSAVWPKHRLSFIRLTSTFLRTLSGFTLFLSPLWKMFERLGPPPFLTRTTSLKCQNIFKHEGQNRIEMWFIYRCMSKVVTLPILVPFYVYSRISAVGVGASGHMSIGSQPSKHARVKPAAPGDSEYFRIPCDKLERR